MSTIMGTGRRGAGARGVALAMLAATAIATAAEPAKTAFDLAHYRQLAASDRAAGIEEGRRALRDGVFADDSRNRMRLLWYMGGAAVGMADDAAIDEVVAALTAIGSEPAAASLAGFLRGARASDLGRPGEGLITVLQAANAVPDDDQEMRVISTAELCRAYSNADLPARGVPHCERHERLARASGDPVALARAQYLEASVLSASGDSAAAIPLWRSAHALFSQAGLDALAGRAAGSLATDLNTTGDYAQALEMGRLAVRAADRVGSALSAGIAETTVADALNGLGRPDEALQVIDAALARVSGIVHPPTLRGLQLARRNALERLGATAEQLAEVDAALTALDGGATAPDQVVAIEALDQRYRQREQDQRIRELEAENDSKEREIEAVRQRVSEHEVALRERRLREMGWTVVSVVLLLSLLVLVYLWLRLRDRAKALGDKAYRDGLTGLPNRRALVERFDGAASDGSGTDALLLLDVDHFKQVNDRHGHAVGDQALIAVATCLKRNAPIDGLAARLGGEEFVVFAPGHDADQALALANRLREDVAASTATAIPITVSIGLAVRNHSAPAKLTDWLGAADAALYAAKAAGRNCAMVASASGMQGG